MSPRKTIVPFVLLSLAACQAGLTPRQAVSAHWPKAIQLTAIVPTHGIALNPRIEGDVVVVPLPPRRDDLLRADVSLRVRDQTDGRLIASQHAVVGRFTAGEGPRFSLPELAAGKYAIEVDTVAFLDGRGPNGSERVRREEDTAFLILTRPERNTTSAPKPRRLRKTTAVEVHFRPGLSEPSELDAENLDALRSELSTTLEQSFVRQAQLDCWASSDGEETANLELSAARCAWFRENVWESLPEKTPRPVLSPPTAHGENNLPFPESSGADAQALRAARERNRVAVLSLWVEE